MSQWSQEPKEFTICNDKSRADQPEQPHSFTCIKNQGNCGFWWGRQDVPEEKGCAEKGNSSCLHASAHQSQVTHPISFKALNGIVETFLCCLLAASSHARSLYLPQKDLRKKTLLTLFTWEQAFCWPFWQLMVRRVEAEVKGQWARLQPSWDSNVQLALTPTEIPLLNGTGAEDNPKLGKKQQESPHNTTSMIPATPLKQWSV